MNTLTLLSSSGNTSLKFEFSRAIGLDVAILEDQLFNGVELKVANFNEVLPLEDNSVNVFIAMMVIEHLFDPFHAG